MRELEGVRERRKQDKAVWSSPRCYHIHLRVFTELEGNTTCTGAGAQQSTRVCACENCRHFRMTHVCSFILSEEETPDIFF